MILFVSKDNPWSRKLYNKLSDYFNTESSRVWWFYGTEYIDFCKDRSPDWVFFFHWSEYVPAEIYENYRCVTIHPANLPEGRGGHPLQNQIEAGITKTFVNAIVTSKEMDSGKIYNRLPLELKGDLENIWHDIADTTYTLILEIISDLLVPYSQEGTPTYYKRRKSNMIPNAIDTIDKFYDQIRMLDAPTYPSAYVNVNGFRLEFSRAQKIGDEILADVKIKRIGSSSTS